MFAPALLEAVREVEEEEEKQQYSEQARSRLLAFPSMPRFNLPSMFLPTPTPLPPAVPLSFQSQLFAQPASSGFTDLPPPLPVAAQLPALPLSFAQAALPLSSSSTAARALAVSVSPPARKSRVIKSHPSPVLSTGSRRARPSKHRSASKEREAEHHVPASPQSVTSVSSAPSSPLSGSVLVPFTMEEDEAFMLEQRREAGERLASGQQQQQQEEDGEDQRTCRYDSESFNSVGEFLDHLKYTHSMSLSQYNKAKVAAKQPRERQSKQKRAEQRKKNEHQCELCRKAFTSLGRLSEHYQQHEAAFVAEDKAKLKQRKANPSAAQPNSPLVAAAKPKMHLVSRLPLPPPPSEAEDDESIVCAVCLSGESTDENLILLCDGPCRFAYHQECIGADYVPEGDWHCSEQCERGEEVTDVARWVKERREQYERRQRERIAAQQSGGNRGTDPAVLMLKGFWEEVDGYFSLRGMVEARGLLDESALDESLMAPVERGRSYREQWADDDARDHEFGGSSRRRQSAAETAAAQRAKIVEEEEEMEDEEDDEEAEEVEELDGRDESTMSREEIAEKRRKEKLRKTLSYEHNSDRMKRVKKKGVKAPAIRLSFHARLSARPKHTAPSTASSSSSPSSSQLDIDTVIESPLSSPISPPLSSPLSSELPSSPLPLTDDEPPSRSLSSPVPMTVRVDSATDESTSTASLQPLAARSNSDGAALTFASAITSSSSDLRPAPLSQQSSNTSAAAPTASPSQGGKQPRNTLSLSSAHPPSNKTPRGNTAGGKAPRTNTATASDHAAMDEDTVSNEPSNQPLSLSSPSSLAPPLSSASPRGKGPPTPMGKHNQPLPASQQSTKAPHTSAPSLSASNEDELRDPIAPAPSLFFTLRSLQGDYMRSVGFRVSAARLSEARDSGAGYVFPPFVYDPHTQTMEGDCDDEKDESEEGGELSSEERRAKRKRDRAGQSGLQLDVVSLAEHEPAALHGTAVEIPATLQPSTAPNSPLTPHALTQRPSRPRAGSAPSAPPLYLSGMATRSSAPVVPLSPLNAAGSPLAVPLGPSVSSSGRPIRLTTRALSSSAFKVPAASPSSVAPHPPAPLIELLPSADTDEVANELWLCQQSYLAQHGHNEHIKAQTLQAVQSDIQHFLAATKLPATFISSTSQGALLHVLAERRRGEREVLDYFAENYVSPKAWREYMSAVEEVEERGDEAADELDEAEEERRREHRKLKRADRIVAKVVGEMVVAVGKAVKQGKDDQKLRHRRERLERRTRKREAQIARRVKGCMDWMLGKIVAKEQLRERRARIRRMNEEEKRREEEKERERRRERRRRRKLKKREKRRAKREKERQRMAKLMRKKEKEKRRRRKEKKRQLRLAREAEEDRRRKRRDKKRRRRRADSSTSASSASSSSDDSSAESSSDSERSVSSASDSEKEEKSEVAKESSSSSASSEDEKAGEEVYCYCRQPYNEHVPMIGCDVCSEWYHGKCVSLTSAEMDNIDSYVCAKCEQHDQRRTTLIHQPADDSEVEILQPHVPAIRLRKVGVEKRETEAVVEEETLAAAERVEKGVAIDGAAGDKQAHGSTIALYEVVSNEGARLADSAEDELLSQPLSIHRAASLKMRLGRLHPLGRASRQKQQWRVVRVVAKNVYWTSESGHNWHYIRESNISSKDKRWIDAPGVDKVYVQDGKWLPQQQSGRHERTEHSDSQDDGGDTAVEGDAVEDMDIESPAINGLKQEAEEEMAGETPKAAVAQRRSHRKAAPKRSHKRKLPDEPLDAELQQQADDEPSNPPVESAGQPTLPASSPPPPAPKVRRPPRPRMSEAQRLTTPFLNPPGPHSSEDDEEDEEDEQQAAGDQRPVDEEADTDMRQEEPAEAVEDVEQADGRRRSGRRRSTTVAVKKKELQQEEKVEEEEDDAGEADKEVVVEDTLSRGRRSTRMQQAKQIPVVQSSAADPGRNHSASPHPASPSPTPTTRTTRRTTNNSAMTGAPIAMTDLNGSDSASSSRKRKPQSYEEQTQQQPAEQPSVAEQPLNQAANSPRRTRNGLNSPTSDKLASPASLSTASPQPSAVQRGKKQRRNGDLELIDSITIFAHRSRRATNSTPLHSHRAVQQEEGEEDDEQPVDASLNNGVAEEQQSQQQSGAAAVDDGRRRSSRSKSASPAQSIAPAAPSPQPQSGRKAAARNGRQQTLLNYFAA